MPRNAEVIRQWTILREIERARAAGVTIDELAVLCRVTTRTIRRDLQALEEAGFPLFDDKGRDDGKTRWLVNGQAFKGVSTGLTVSELCALHFGDGQPAGVEHFYHHDGMASIEHLFRAADELKREHESLFKEKDLSGEQYNVLRILRGAGKVGLHCNDRKFKSWRVERR